MASATKSEKTGLCRVLFYPPGCRKRQTLRLGKVSKRVAKEIARHIDLITASRKAGLPLDEQSETWLARLPDRLRRRLVMLKVIGDAGRKKTSTLGGFLDDYIASRSDKKPGTLSNLRTARRWLEKHFGPEREIDSIAPGDADRYRAWLSSEGKQAENTIRRLCGRAKEFFRAALRQRLIRENPFADMKKLVVGASPKHRVRFIDRARIEKVLAACPDDEWRLIVALARYGGFRIPSELVALKWEHIDWEAGRITVTSIKTEHHEGHETRETPIFPELRPYLEKWRDQSARNEGWVFSRRWSKSTNLRTPFMRILRKAKVKPWPKLFQNQRSSRETELLKEFPVHVVCAWLGNTPRVALKHYAQVTDEDFKKATRGDSKRQAG
jgi:integrase